MRATPPPNTGECDWQQQCLQGPHASAREKFERIFEVRVNNPASVLSTKHRAQKRSTWFSFTEVLHFTASQRASKIQRDARPPPRAHLIVGQSQDSPGHQGIISLRFVVARDSRICVKHARKRC